MRRGFFGDEDVGAFVLFVRGEDLLFVVTALGVDFPGVEFGAAEEAEGGVVGGEHYPKLRSCHLGLADYCFGPSKATTRLRSKAVSMDFLRESLKMMILKNYEKKNVQFLFSHFSGYKWR